MTMVALKSYSRLNARSCQLTNWRVPLSDLDYGPEEELAVSRILKSGWLSMGPEVEAFEREFAEFVGVRHALAVANGTAALHLSYMALGIGLGDEVIQPAINFVAAANMTIAVGATPVFADITSLAEPLIDPQEIEDLITKRTKAVVVMHYGGYVADMNAIRQICDQHNLVLIEDACHAVGARCGEADETYPRGKMAGAIGDIGCFSFFSNKNLAIGEGGMVVTNRTDLAERLHRLRSHGMTSLSWDRHRGHARTYDVTLNGYNYRLDDLRAALARTQLAKLERNNSRRRELVLLYRHKLADHTDWIVPFSEHTGYSSAHLMVLLAPNENLRDRTVETLTSCGIQTSRHYPCVTDFSAYGHFQSLRLHRSLAFTRRNITLPLFPHLSTAAVGDICSKIRAIRE